MNWIVRHGKMRFAGWLALGVVISSITLGWFGYTAVTEWQRSVAMLAAHRADSAADLVLTALTRDMRGSQSLTLSALQLDHLNVDRPYELRQEIASALARYPYPEAFFGWRGDASHAGIVFFCRHDRQAPWMVSYEGAQEFPVVLGSAPTLATKLQERIARDITRGRQYSFFDLTIAGKPYQVVTRMFYRDARPDRPEGAVGFLVNLDWVRQFYFADLVRQMAGVLKAEGSLTITVSDFQERVVAVTGESAVREPVAVRHFPLLFLDPQLATFDPPSDIALDQWIIKVSAGNDATLRLAVRGARRTLFIAAIAATVLAGALVMTVQAVRAHAHVAEIRSEFVATVTHELKTPIAGIRAIGETIMAGRVDPERSRSYARMAVQEAKRLTRLINNLLTYAHTADLSEVYSFEATALEPLVRNAIQEFAAQLASADFTVVVEIPASLPPVRVDRRAFGQVMDNVIDNAIRYTKERRTITIEARLDGSTVVVDIIDEGVGIPEAELQQVTRKFFRGRESSTGGSGLGLAIVQRIMEDHRGTLRIRSQVGVGTTVSLTFPVA